MSWKSHYKLDKAADLDLLLERSEWRVVALAENLTSVCDRHRKTTAEQKQGGGGVTSLTCTEGVDVLVELEPHHGPIVVDDVGLTVPSTRHHLLSAVPLEEDTNTDTHRVAA